MPAIDQGGELDSGRPAEGTDCIHRRAHCSSGVENVIDNDQGPTFQRQWEFRLTNNWQLSAGADVVAMHRNIDNPRLDLDLFTRTDELGDAACDFHSARRNSRKHDRAKIRIALDDFVRNAAKSALNGSRVHDWDGGRS